MLASLSIEGGRCCLHVSYWNLLLVASELRQTIVSVPNNLQYKYTLWFMASYTLGVVSNFFRLASELMFSSSAKLAKCRVSHLVNE